MSLVSVWGWFRYFLWDCYSYITGVLMSMSLSVNVTYTCAQLLVPCGYSEDDAGNFRRLLVERLHLPVSRDHFVVGNASALLLLLGLVGCGIACW